MGEREFRGVCGKAVSNQTDSRNSRFIDSTHLADAVRLLVARLGGHLQACRKHAGGMERLAAGAVVDLVAA